MAVATVLSRAQHGMDAPLVRVEVDLGSGLPKFAIVGLPEAVVKESKDRVRARDHELRLRIARRPHHRESVARRSSQGRRPVRSAHRAREFCSPPVRCRRSSSPTASCTASCRSAVSCSRCSGALLAAVAAARGGQSIIVPRANGCRGRARVTVAAIAVAATSARCHAAHATGAQPLQFIEGAAPAMLAGSAYGRPVRGARSGACETRARDRGGGRAQPADDRPSRHRQEHARAAPAGSAAGDDRSRSARGRGRAQRRGHALKAARVASAAVSQSASHGVGGRAGRRRCAAAARRDLARAHGVLFLDELPEFDRRVLEVAARADGERHRSTISRAARQAEFPAAFQLVAAMNPCPCGYLGDMQGRCRCTQRAGRSLSRPAVGPVARSARPAHRSAARSAADACDARDAGSESERARCSARRARARATA